MSIFNKETIGRPRKERNLSLNHKEYQNDSYMKTVVLNIRVSESEKEYLKNIVKSKSTNISSYIRRLIFEVYFYKLKNKELSLIHALGNGDYAFIDKRTSFIYVRLTEIEKMEVERLSNMYHRSISEFIRWLAIEVPIDELISC